MHATAFLRNPEKIPLKPVVVVHGPDVFLRGEVLHTLCERWAGGDAQAASVIRLPGGETPLHSVTDELRTVSLWGEVRVVVVDDADAFVSGNRSGLEKYVAAPAGKSALLLSVKSWPKNTRLARALHEAGLEIDCSELKGAALLNWLMASAEEAYGKQLGRSDAELLVELAGTETGLLTQELAKLACYVGERRGIGETDIRALVGGWGVRTAFAMVDTLLVGRLPQALKLLDALLAAGEPPQRILGAISFSFRRLAVATERARHGMRLREALAQAGVFRNRVDAANGYLRRLGRGRAEELLGCILQTDLNLKGGSRAAGRVELERLLVQLAGPAPGRSL